MKQKTSIIRFLAIGFVMVGFFSACSPNVVRNIYSNYPALDNSVEVKVIKVGESIPFKYEELGSLKLGDGGITNKSKCTYEALVALAIEEAKKVGGNAIKIVEHTPPSVKRFGTGIAYDWCHALHVLILKTDEAFD